MPKQLYVRILYHVCLSSNIALFPSYTSLSLPLDTLAAPQHSLPCGQCGGLPLGDCATVELSPLTTSCTGLSLHRTCAEIDLSPHSSAQHGTALHYNVCCAVRPAEDLLLIRQSGGGGEISVVGGKGQIRRLSQSLSANIGQELWQVSYEGRVAKLGVC